MTFLAQTWTAAEREQVAFRTSAQELCVDVAVLSEIGGRTPVTPIPQTPCYAFGVINWMGVALPIIDLKARLGMMPTEPTVRPVNLVVEIKRRLVGVLVETVSDFLTVANDNIQPGPDGVSEFERTFARGFLARKGQMIGLIELDAVIPQYESEAA